ncbi:hypothetical protein L7F22_064952 [Adiantum nelumboides]|nr:hypothetical protein [Adiantum nelumboides]
MLFADLCEEECMRYLQMLSVTGFPTLFIDGYDKIIGISVVQHHINLKEGSKPTVQRLQPLGVIQQDVLLSEVRKLLQASFIYPMEDSEWVSPMVVTSKKNGKWRVCVDYKPLNAATKRNRFPLPFKDEILNEVAGYECYTVCDGYSGLQTLGGQLNVEKCHIAESKVALLGHVILAKGIEVDPNKVQALVSLSPPTTAKPLVSFLQKVRYLSALNHMTNHGEWFKELQALQNLGYVETGDDTAHPIVHTGHVPLSLQDGNVKYLVDVLHVPNITKNLVSIGQMVEQGLQEAATAKIQSGHTSHLGRMERDGFIATFTKDYGHPLTLAKNIAATSTGYRALKSTLPPAHTFEVHGQTDMEVVTREEEQGRRIDEERALALAPVPLAPVPPLRPLIVLTIPARWRVTPSS